MSRAEEVYHYSKSIAREISKLEHNAAGEFNSPKILEFYNQLVAEGVSAGRRLKYLVTLRTISQILGKPFPEVTKDDIIRFVAYIEQKDYSDWTKRDYKLLLKRFFKWFRGCEEGYPPEVKWIKTKESIESPIRKKDLLTVDEIEAIANATQTQRDRALIWVYFESMRRLGEIMNLNIGDVEFDELGARLRVDGKVGPDDGRIVFSAPMLANWLDIHPRKDDPAAPLWVALDSRKKTIRRFGYNAARAMFKDCAVKAGIKKRVWLYLIRHSRITLASKVLPHALLCRTAGWKQGSRMPQVYIHLAGEDLDDAHRMLNGIVRTDIPDEGKVVPVVCSRCSTQNIPGSKFCARCSCPLSVEVALQVNDARKKADRLMDELVKCPEILEQMLQAIEAVKH